MNTIPIRKIFKIPYRVAKGIFRLRMIPTQHRLSQIKHDQVMAFNALRNSLFDTYNHLKKYNISQFTTPLWDDFNAKLETALLPSPSFSFLRNPIIRHTMFVDDGGKWLNEEIKFLEDKIDENKLKDILQEDYVGNPHILNSKYLTSHNSIHHLYHIIRFLDRTKCDPEQINTIVEWGGGYGNMAKIFKRLKSAPCTYIIIDTPLFSCIQWLYLTTILGEQHINLVKNPEDTIHMGKINLMPLCFLDYHNISADLFISTWALSESSKYSQDYVVAHKWFNSKHILIAYQESNSDLPYAGRVGRIAAADIGAVIEDIEFLPGNHYAFR